MYKRKTTDVYELHGDYGTGLELICCYSTREEAREDKRAYIENDENVRNLTIKKRREKI